METHSEMERVIARMPKHAQGWIRKQLDSNVDLAFKNEPYFSRVRFEPTITVDGALNTTSTFAAGQVAQAFAYGQNGAMTPAGFSAAGTGYTTGTAADTNLITTTGKVTNNSDLVVVDGLAIIPTTRSDATLLKQVICEMSVSAGFGGNQNDFKFGNPLFWPGSAGLHGNAESVLSPSPIASPRGNVGTTANGLPGAADVRWFTDPIVWMPAPEGDSVFSMQIKIERAVTYVATARVAAAGVAGVVPPTTAGAEGTYVEFFVLLLGNQFGPRSRNR